MRSKSPKHRSAPNPRSQNAQRASAPKPRAPERVKRKGAKRTTLWKTARICSRKLEARPFHRGIGSEEQQEGIEVRVEPLGSLVRFADSRLMPPCLALLLCQNWDRGARCRSNIMAEWRVFGFAVCWTVYRVGRCVLYYLCWAKTCSERTSQTWRQGPQAKNTSH